MQRHKLAVQVGKCNGIAVKQAQLPYPAAGQYLNSLPADAADAKNGHMGAAQYVQCGCAQLGTCAGVLIGHGVTSIIILPPSARQTPTIWGKVALAPEGEQAGLQGRRERTLRMAEIFRTVARFSPPLAAASTSRGAKKYFISFFSPSVPAPSHSSTTSCRPCRQARPRGYGVCRWGSAATCASG